MLLAAALSTLAGCAEPSEPPAPVAHDCAPTEGPGPTALVSVAEPGGKPSAGMDVYLSWHNDTQPFVTRGQDDVTDEAGCVAFLLSFGRGIYEFTPAGRECLHAQARLDFGASEPASTRIELDLRCEPARGHCRDLAETDRSSLLVHVTDGMDLHDVAGAQVTVSVERRDGEGGEVVAKHSDGRGCAAFHFMGAGVYVVEAPYSGCVRTDRFQWDGNMHMEWMASRPVGNGEGPDPCPAR